MIYQIVIGAQSTCLQTTQRFSMKSAAFQTVSSSRKICLPWSIGARNGFFSSVQKSQSPTKGKSRLVGRKYCAENKHPDTIAESTTEVDLGVSFDNELKFEMYSVNKVNIANKIFGLIRKTFNCLTWTNSDRSSSHW